MSQETLNLRGESPQATQSLGEVTSAQCTQSTPHPLPLRKSQGYPNYFTLSDSPLLPPPPYKNRVEIRMTNTRAALFKKSKRSIMCQINHKKSFN